MELKQSSRLLTLAAGLTLGASLFGTSAVSAASMDGKALVEAHCLTCHEVKGGEDFGNVGPSLVDLKARYPNRRDVTAIIFDETKRNPQTVMPPFGRNLVVTDKEIAAMVDFLYTQ